MSSDTLKCQLKQDSGELIVSLLEQKLNIWLQIYCASNKYFPVIGIYLDSKKDVQMHTMIDLN